MRFIPNGPDVPEELLTARDRGDVIFFCGAGVSQANARLPNFEVLSQKVISILGSAQDSPARRLLGKALEMGRMAGVGGLLATDRVFGLLEREFESSEVRAAVAQAIRPAEGYDLNAHRILLDLATSGAGVTRLVTTNFDGLFEECGRSLPCHGPPRLPDPRSDRDFRGIVHLHGRVDSNYCSPHDDEFVISSADFGRAYLSDGWATRFIQALLARFQIAFVGYSADDPPVQYLLEALNLGPGNKSRLFAFQEGNNGEASALWEHRGVRAIPFDSSNGFAPLWDTLAAWAKRSRDVDAWYSELINDSLEGPMVSNPHHRGQLAKVFSTREGAHRFATANTPLGAEWLLVLDPNERYGDPVRRDPNVKSSEIFDPFDALSLDSDAPPTPSDPEDHFRRREPPDDAVDAFAINRWDEDDRALLPSGRVHGAGAEIFASLPPRLASLGVWIRRVAHQPIALWWAAKHPKLHPVIQRDIEFDLHQQPDRFSEQVRRGWTLLFAAWKDDRPHPNLAGYELARAAGRFGWTNSLTRQLADIFKPRLQVRAAVGVRHPLLWSVQSPNFIVTANIEYPSPHEELEIAADQVPYAVCLFRQNLELAISLEHEIRGDDALYLQTSRSDDDGPELRCDEYGITGPIVYFQKLMRRWAALDPLSAEREVLTWPGTDRYVFARLRIWAAGQEFVAPAKAANIFLGLPDDLFWGSLHGRDLLYAMRDRWKEFPQDLRLAIEGRLLTGAYPWNRNFGGAVERLAASDRLSRLHWLSKQGAQFSFDLSAEFARLIAVAPEWTERLGDGVADSTAPVVRSIETDDRPDSLLSIPVSDILSEARSISRFDFLGGVQPEPFRGLASSKPARALAALTHVGRRGEAPIEAWSDFLRVDKRASDSLRMLRVITGRLERLPIERLQEIAYPVTDWMLRICDRLYGDAEKLLPGLWGKLINALALVDYDRDIHTERSWADDALNSPIGRLVDLLFKDPANNALAAGEGFPASWRSKTDQLLSLPENWRCQTLVMLISRLAWLFHVDPQWSERQLLPSANAENQERTAFWEGVFWSAQMSLKLFIRLKSQLVELARMPQSHRRPTNVLATYLFNGWLTRRELDASDRLLSDVEFREILIHAEDEFRVQIIWHVEQWVVQDPEERREEVAKFLSQVWPKQRALRTSRISARLASFALSSGPLMPTVVELILPRLVPICGESLNSLALLDNEKDNPIRLHPTAALDLLCAILADDPSQWPYGTVGALDVLAKMPEVTADSRLSELRRRRGV